MTSPEFRTQSNLTGDALGPNEPERDTSEVIIIGEDSRAITFDTSYLSQEEVTQLAALQQKVRARQEAASPLDTRQANSLVEAVALTPDPEKQREFAEHFLYTLARQHGTVGHEELRSHVEYVLDRAHKLGQGALEAISTQALEFKDALLRRKDEELKALRIEASEARIETALLAVAVERAFDEDTAYFMGDPEEMARIELLRDRVRQSTDSSIWEMFDAKQDESVLDAPTQKPITTDELESMSSYVTAEDVSPARGIALEQSRALEEALALARPSSEF